MFDLLKVKFLIVIKTDNSSVLHLEQYGYIAGYLAHEIKYYSTNFLIQFIQRFFLQNPVLVLYAAILNRI